MSKRKTRKESGESIMVKEQNLQGKKILIVEDESHIAEGVAFNLKKEGFEVKIAVNGVEFRIEVNICLCWVCRS